MFQPISKLLLALTMLVSTSAAQAYILNFIDSYEDTFEICGDEVEWTGFIKVFDRNTANRTNINVNIVASGIGESGDIYSLTSNGKVNLQESDNQFFASDTLRLKVRNTDTGERYWLTTNFRFVANVGAGVVYELDYDDWDACFFN